MKIYIVVFVFTNLFHILVGYTDLGKLGCSDTAHNSKCVMNETCLVQCNFPCHKTDIEIWGAVKYTYDSPICKAAVHDLRISTWNSNARTVWMKRIPHYNLFYGSVRFGFKSSQYGPLKRWNEGSIIFLSPRISEEILEIFSVHRNYIFERNQGHIQQCFMTYDERKIHFDTYSERRHIPEDINRDPPAVIIGNIMKYEIHWPPDLIVRTSGGFQCIPEKSMLSIVTSLAMRKDAYFVPDMLTVTVNYGENFTLTMNELHKGTSQTTWKKDMNIIIPNIPQKKGSRTSLTLLEVQVGSAGIYSLEYRWIPESTPRRGIIRLIVRACPEKQFGNNCSYECPKCQNGGVCHDITGICVCPPGFNGTLCENACEPGNFGHTCSMHCSNDEIYDKKNVSCQGLLICAPDPYGCSCASGFKNISCDVACSHGEYGAGCSQRRNCRCAGGKSCDIYSGLCYNGCDEGWHGPACIISYPVLHQLPRLLNTTIASITFSFRQWNESSDGGVGTPSSYLIVFKEVNESESWTHGSYLDAKSFDDIQVVTISHLKKGTSYAIAVVVFDVSGEKQFENLTSIEGSTLCDKAESPPIDIESEATETQVNISWKLPPKATWNCQSVSVWLMYESREYSVKVEVHNSFYTFRTRPFTLWNVTICLAPQNDNLTTSCTDLTVVSQEGTPGTVSDIQYESLEPRTVKLVWTPPTEQNGIIRNYILRYQQISWAHTCNLPTDLEVKEMNTTTNSIVLTLLKPSSYYYINVSAVTIKRGPGVITNIKTEMDDPDGVARDIIFLQLSNRIFWSAPQCDDTYGDVSFYKVVISGQSAWDLSERNVNVTTDFLDAEGLLPFSNYSVTIYVANKHGISKNYSERLFKTKAGAPPQPSNLTVFSRTSSSLSFSWIPPYPPYGSLEHYTIRYGVVQNVTSSIAAYPANTVCKDTIRKNRHCYSITGLEINKEYKIGVKAFNVGIDKGSPFNFVFARTVESVPDAPHSLSISNRTDAFVDLQWEEPYVTNGNLTNFRVNLTIMESFSASVAGFDSLTNVTGINVRHYVLTNLAPATIYKSCVEASTKAGFGKPNCVTFNTSNVKPIINTEPSLLGKSEEKIFIRIFTVKALGGPISAYLVIVNPISIVLRPKRHVSPTMLETRNCPSKSHAIMTKYIAAKIYEVPEDGVNFTIGDGKCENGFYNAPLKTGVTYMIGISVMSVFGNEVKYSDIKYISRPILVSHQVIERRTHYTGAIFGFVVPLLLIIIIMTILVYLKRPKWLYGNRRLRAIKMRILPSKKDEALFSSTNEALAEELEEGDFEIETESLSEESSNRIPVKQLEMFVQKSLLNGAIKKEYMSLPKGQKFACDHAKIPGNKVKNRYGNLLPYDHTRVILNIAADDSSSDYINANYIAGYKYEKKYIATQGPKQETIGDFWRMIWGEGSCKILMVTNLTEGGKSKCTKYWPDSQQIEINPFDDFSVSFIEAEQYADFIIRTFHISKVQETREVKQFHFQTWPDHGVPMYSPPVVSFLKKVSLYQPNNKKPIVIHCSAGIGRTGTLILFDSMIDMGKAEDHVDLLCHLNTMRRQRSNIVENVDQYIFVYNTLVETLCGIDTCIPCADFLSKLPVLRTTVFDDHLTFLELEFQILTKQKPLIVSTDTRNALQPENKEKNRNSKILPPDRARPILIMNSLSVGSDYINAVYVNGYRQKDAYLVTQYPLLNTIYDFWRMICENKCRTIVLLHSIEFNEDSSSYWPEENNVFVYEGFKIKCQSTNKGDMTSLWNFVLYPDSEMDGPPLITSLIELHTWHAEEMCPSDPNLILTLLDQVERRQQQLGKHKVTVQCFDGVAGCGIFCAASFLSDKIKTEQDVDVFQAVKSVRTNRPEFIKNMEQYSFLYDIAETFLEKFEMYANFQ